jgi:putative ABC transport system permease protein
VLDVLGGSPPALHGPPAAPGQAPAPAQPTQPAQPVQPQSAPPDPGTAAPPRRTRGGVILLPPWTRAPLRSFRHPAVLLAVIGAAAILTCASSSAAWFLSSASSASLQKMAAANCPDFSYPQVTVEGGAGAGERYGTAVSRDFADQGLGRPYRNQVAMAATPVSRGIAATQVRLWYGQDAVRNITPLHRAGGRGVWLAADAADQLGVGAGDTVNFGPRNGARVVGVYRNLYEEPVRPYWCSYRNLFQNLTFANVPPPPLAIATDPAVLTAVLEGNGDLFGNPARVDTSWTAPIEGAHLTVTGARSVLAAQDRVAGALRQAAGGDGDIARVVPNPNLRDFADQATRIRDGLRGPVLPIALGGTLLALLLVGAAGSYWADRRYAEVRLLASRGVGPGGLAALAALELTVPAVIGAAAGLVLALLLVRGFGPAPDLDAWAPRFAALTSVAALAAGIALLAAVAGIRARNTVELPIGGRRRWPALVPWELAVLAAAGLAYRQLARGAAVSVDHNVAQVNLLLVAYPLLFLAGAAVLVVRLLTLLLPLLRRVSVRFGPALYLAARRVVAAPLVSATVLAAMSLPIGVLVYSGAITQTTSYTLDAKTRVFTGGVVQLSSTDLPRDAAALNRVGTTVLRYEDATSDGSPVTVLAVDPGSFARYAFWDGRFAGRSLPALLADIRGPRTGAALAAVGLRLGAGQHVVELGKRTLTVSVVDTAAVLPGQRSTDPMLLVDAAALGPVDNTAKRFTEVWTGDEPAAQRAMSAQGMQLFTVSTDEQVRNVANFLGVSWAFGYLEALAALVGLVAVGGLLLYLETRQRQRVAAYALARRMGLSRRAHLCSLLAELATLIGAAVCTGASLALVAVLSVYHRLDLDTYRPPPPLLSLPVAALGLAALAAAAVAVFGAAYAHHAASRANTAEVMRLGG